MGGPGCVTITKTSKTLVKGAAPSGVYQFSYDITFVGKYLRGKVPAMQVWSPTQNLNVKVSTSTSLPSVNFIAAYPVTGPPTVQIGDVSQPGSSSVLAHEVVVGNQPNGGVNLRYTCESRTVSSSLLVSHQGTQIQASSGIFELYQFVRIEKTYHQITYVSSNSSVAKITPSYSSNVDFTTNDAEVGVFYSDPKQGISLFVI